MAALLHPLFLSPPGHAQARLPVGQGIVEIRAEKQMRDGKILSYVGSVEVTYQKTRLLADRMDYNGETKQLSARGHVRFEYETQHVEAAEAEYNLRTGRGVFRNVRGSFRVERLPNANVLLSDNPIQFEARDIERVDERTYRIRGAWLTVCTPDQPIWKFYAPRATIQLEKQVRLEHASFRILSVPVLYLPRATAPAGKRVRQSGFLLPHAGNSSRKGFVLGDSFYWAPKEWLDLTVGAEYLSRRGYSQLAELRATPRDTMNLQVNYFGVNDRGLIGPGGVRLPQGGHESRVRFDALLAHGWRAVADLNKLTSLNFRLAFAETFSEATNPQTHSAAFVVNNFRGFSLSFFTLNYKNFLSATPETAALLRAAPAVRLSSVEQAPWKRLPLYLGFETRLDAVHRSDPALQTPEAVQRLEVAPRVTIPLRWGPWLGVTPSFTWRSTYYGAQVQAGAVTATSIRRTSAELTTDIRPPAFSRIWERGAGQRSWKHSLEPQVVYRFVDGIENFARFLRFDEQDTLTDTHELEYTLTQRLFLRSPGKNAEELVRLRVTQKYFFDPTFGGAVVSGRRNVFQSLQALTPFAFADGERRFSPVVADLRFLPGSRYDAQVRMDYDTTRSRMTAFGTLVNVRPYRESFFTVAHFATRSNPLLQPRSHQVRALVGYGAVQRRGLNALFGMSYDVRQKFFQNQVVQISVNGSCCGVGFEYRRLALGPLRSENQFRVALMIANIGTFGNLRRQEKVF
jgi:LPS-assembly protein